VTGPRRGIACAGNWIVDIVHSIDRWPRKSDLVHIRDEAVGVGGGAANVALDLAAFGVAFPVVPVGLLGMDLHGHAVRDALTTAGLSDRWMARTEAAATAHTHVMTVQGDSRTFFYHPGTNDLLDEEHIPVESLGAEGIALFYLGYLNLMARLDRVGTDGQTPAARLLARARAAGMITCVDLVSAESEAFDRTVAAALPQIDYLFLNEVEAERASREAVAGPEDREGLLAAAKALQARGARRVVIHTPAMSLWLGREAIWAEAQQLPPEDIVSPVGAGDAFCAGCLYGIHEGWTPERSLWLGHRAASASLKGATATDGIPPLSVLLNG